MCYVLRLDRLQLAAEGPRISPGFSQLLKGKAEVFGAEIVPDTTYKFADANVGVFTWHGCTLEVVGEVTLAYISRETPMRL